VLKSGDERMRRSLGVLLNPLFGFTPKSRPIFWRILSIRCVLSSRSPVVALVRHSIRTFADSPRAMSIGGAPYDGTGDGHTPSDLGGRSRIRTCLGLRRRIYRANGGLSRLGGMVS
jgi:hypothetical protein